jgi:hypothetical protein
MKLSKLLVALLFIVACFLVSPLTVLAADETEDGVSLAEAKKVAVYYVTGYSETIKRWSDATVGQATEYYTDDRISAYEFKVTHLTAIVRFCKFCNSARLAFKACK